MTGLMQNIANNVKDREQSMRMKFIINMGMVLSTCLATTVSLGEMQVPDLPFHVRMNLNRDLSIVPNVNIENKSASPLKIVLSSRLESIDGKYEREISFSQTLPANEKRVIPVFGADGPDKITDRIMLVLCDIQCGPNQKVTLSAICGTPQPVNPKKVNVFGMNIHLARYSPEEQWKLLRLASAAGITSVREDAGFQISDKDGNYSGIADLEQTVLAGEAFGIETLMNLSYFPPEFYVHAEKNKLCHGWAVAMARHYKGRVHSWEYGNETNSGWAGYGAAADMARHNIAMAQGTLSVDPKAKVSSFGIAEGHPSYVQALWENHAGEYLNAINIHPYCGTPESGILKCLDNRRVAGMFGGHQEIWATEIGFNYHEGEGLNPLTKQLTQVNGFNLAQQADFIVRLYALAKATGIERVYWYDFFGKNDPETFWIIDENFKPRIAYTALVKLATLLKGTVPIGGTDLDELVQKHYFKCQDGSVVLIAWALQDGVSTNLSLPKNMTASDFLGKKVVIESGRSITLGHRPIYIKGLNEKHMTSFINKDILVNAMDKRNWNGPLHRWRVSPGEKIQVPCVIYNSTQLEIAAQPIVLRTMPGWEIDVPSPIKVAAGKTETSMFTITAPADTVPGVEYHFDFAANINDLQRSLPYTARVKVEGKFPYDEILSDCREPDYPMWDRFDEAKVGSGNCELRASFGEAEINGNLKEWRATEFYPIDQKFMWLLRDPEQPDYRDWTGKVALRWDEKNLYAAFIVLDDDLCMMDFVSRDWRDNDNVRLFLSTESDPAKRTDLISEKDYAIFMAPTGLTHTEPPVVFSASIGGKVHDGFETKVTIQSRVWSGGYVIEVAIPFEAMNYKPTAGATMGLNVLSDDVDHGYRQNSCMTYFKDVSYWNSPKSLGSLVFDPSGSKTNPIK
jgi:hypothetical protein